MRDNIVLYIHRAHLMYNCMDLHEVIYSSNITKWVLSLVDGFESNIVPMSMKVYPLSNEIKHHKIDKMGSLVSPMV